MSGRHSSATARLQDGMEEVEEEEEEEERARSRDDFWF